MTKEKSLPLNERLTKKPTKWLIDLPAGKYTVKQLEEATGKVSTTIKQRLNLLEIPRTYNASSGYPLVVYTWKGIAEYEREIKKKIKEKCKDELLNHSEN